MANAIAQTLLAKRTHKVAGRGRSRAMQFKNGQILVTVPREIARWKHISKVRYCVGLVVKRAGLLWRCYKNNILTLLADVVIFFE